MLQIHPNLKLPCDIQDLPTAHKAHKQNKGQKGQKGQNGHRHAAAPVVLGSLSFLCPTILKRNAGEQACVLPSMAISSQSSNIRPVMPLVLTRPEFPKTVTTLCNMHVMQRGPKKALSSWPSAIHWTFATPGKPIYERAGRIELTWKNSRKQKKTLTNKIRRPKWRKRKKQSPSNPFQSCQAHIEVAHLLKQLLRA